MAEAKLVKDQAVEGGRLIQQLRKDGMEVTSACWLMDNEREDWELYIVSKSVDIEGVAVARLKLKAAFQQLSDLWLDSSEVRIVSPNDPVAEQIAAIQQRVPVRLKTRHYVRLDGLRSGEMHVYPQLGMP